MKKSLLLGLALSLGVFSFGQSYKKNNDYKNYPKTIKIDQPLGGNNDVRNNASSIPAAIPSTTGSRVTVGTVIGNTKYDLQTNAAMPRRIVNFGDGTIGATWTFSGEESFATRGTGYNYFNGSAWGAAPTSPIESSRNGWPSIAKLGASGEVIFSHGNNIGALIMSQRTPKGTGSWDETLFNNTEAPYDTVKLWHRMATGGSDGKTIHTIGRTESASPDPVYFGMSGALLYSRSTDGGATWDITNTVIPGLDATNYTGIGGDAYALDAVGNYVAIAVGDLANGVALFKSEDNGTTWKMSWALKPDVPKFDEKIHLVVDTTINADWNNPLGANFIDTTDAASMRAMPSSDGSVSVIIDDDGFTHVFYGYQEITNDKINDTFLGFYQSINGIGYWNESMEGINTDAQLIADAPDLDGDGVTRPAVNLAGTAYSFASYSFQGLASQPQAAVDDNGCVYLVYAAINELLDNTDFMNYPDPVNFRHIYAVKSCDGGCTWSEPVDITPYEAGDFQECVYPSIARKIVDGYADIIFQSDFFPSVNLVDEANHGVVDNNIVYVKISVDEFSDTPYGCLAYVEPFSTDEPLCFGDSLTLKANCGLGYKWNNVEGEQTLGVTEAGNYELIITTQCGDDTLNIDVPLVIYPEVTLTLEATVEYCDLADGAVNTTITGSAAPYTYNWSNGKLTSTLTGLSADEYILTLTDKNSCTIIDTAEVLPSTNILTLSITDAATTECGATNGETNIVVTGGFTGYSFLWSNGSTVTSLSALSSGIYTVTVTDAANCVKIGNALINDTSPISVSVTNQVPVTCYNETNGQLEVTIDGSGVGQGSPTSALAFAWTDYLGVDKTTLFTSGNDSTSTATALGAGTYLVSITATQSAGGFCHNFGSFTINQPDSLALTLTKTNPVCVAAADGTAMVVATGGNTGYTYLWTSASTATSSTGLVAGTEMVTVTDAKGCFTIDSIALVDPSAITITLITTNPKCNGNTDGTGIAAAVGGAGNFTYSWSNLSTTSVSLGLGAGELSLTVTDNKGCIESKSTTLTEPAVLTVTGVTVTDQAFIGAINITVAGGTPAYAYSWSGVGTYTSTVQNPNDIPAKGTYKVDITDSKGCSTSKAGIVVAGSVSIDEMENTSEIDVYPNPNTGVFTLTVSGVDSYNATLRNVLGQTVMNKTVNTNTTTFDVSSFEKGIYFLTINNGKGETTKRVIIN